MSRNTFLFSQLVRRDFQDRYKRTIFGMAWSVLSPLFTLLVMLFVFGTMFGKNIPHYITYLFAGNIVMAYFREATKSGMQSLMRNAKIITKINVPKYMFLLSRIVSSLVNFLLTIAVFFVFCFIDHITFTPAVLMMWYPVVMLTLINIGIGMILSVFYVFFRDITYLYDIFLRLLTYLSAIFYTIDSFPSTIQHCFLANPVYVCIKYIRVIVIEGTVPSLAYHLLMAGFALVFLVFGARLYIKYNHEFIYYL